MGEWEKEWHRHNDSLKVYKPPEAVPVRDKEILTDTPAPLPLGSKTLHC